MPRLLPILYSQFYKSMTRKLCLYVINAGACRRRLTLTKHIFMKIYIFRYFRHLFKITFMLQEMPPLQNTKRFSISSEARARRCSIKQFRILLARRYTYRSFAYVHALLFLQKMSYFHIKIYTYLCIKYVHIRSFFVYNFCLHIQEK